MSIDGIGKRGGVVPGASVPSAAPAPASFEVGAAPAVSPPGAVEGAGAAAGSDAFQALERGELSVEQYLDARVESAVEPLLSRLSPEQLEFVRGELRAALSTDPVLVELVRKTTSGAASGA
jgi:hypothetical protein